MNLIPEALLIHSDLDSSRIWGRFWSRGPEAGTGAGAGAEAGVGVGAATWVGVGVGAGAWAVPEVGRGGLLPGW